MKGADRIDESRALELQLKDALDLARQRHDHAYQQFEVVQAEASGLNNSVRAYRAASRDYSAALQGYFEALKRFRDYMLGKMPNK